MRRAGGRYWRSLISDQKTYEYEAKFSFLRDQVIVLGCRTRRARRFIFQRSPGSLFICVRVVCGASASGQLKMKTIEEIKAECERAIALAEKATPGPWEASTVEDIGGASIYGNMNAEKNRDKRCVAIGIFDTKGDAGLRPQICTPLFSEECDANTAHIAHARTFTPTAAQALLSTIQFLQYRSRYCDWPEVDTVDTVLKEIQQAFS